MLTEIIGRLDEKLSRRLRRWKMNAKDFNAAADNKPPRPTSNVNVFSLARMLRFVINFILPIAEKLQFDNRF